MSGGEFSVYWWSALDARSYAECRFVTQDLALAAFKRLTTGPASLLVATRVIVTDAGDCIAAEWVKGKGLTFPSDLEA